MDLQTLLDERDISRGLSTFARILDTKSWRDLPTVFAADLSFDYGTGEEHQGIAALESTMRQFLDVCGKSQHLLGSLLVDVGGDRATSRAYVQARHQALDPASGAVFDTNGEYIDQWQRQNDGWRVVRRDVSWFTFAGDSSVIGM